VPVAAGCLGKCAGKFVVKSAGNFAGKFDNNWPL